MPDFEAALSHFHVQVDGKDLSDDEKRDILDITVENSLHLPDMFTLRLTDPQFDWIDRDLFKPGVEVVIFAGYETSNALRRICCGEVTAVEMELNAATTPFVLIRGYDRSHRLQKGRVSRSFVKMKDSDIVQKLAQEVGLHCEADSSGPALEYVFQNNQTNWDFLQERSRRIGYECFVADDNKLYFRKPKNGQAPLVKLEWGVNLRAYRPRVTAARQVGEVTVLGWDPKTKKEITGRCSTANGAPEIDAKPGPDTAREAFGGPRMVVVDRPVHTQDEADRMAASIFEELAQDYVTAEGVALGLPDLKAGVVAEIKNLGQKFSGKYYVTSTTHTWTPDEGYMTSFVVGGKHAHTITDLLGDGPNSGDRSGRSVLNPAGGNIVVGVVTENVDPEGLGRIKVKYPWLVQGHNSHWARLSTPMAGPKRGFYWIPEIDDEVLVAFEHGDMHRPYVIGCLWNGKDLPIKKNDECVQDGKVNLRLIRTRYGHDFVLDDTKDNEQVRIQTPYDNRFRMIDGKQTGSKGIFMQTGLGHKGQMVDEDGNQFIGLETKGHYQIYLHDTKKHVLISTPGKHQIQLDDDQKQIVIIDQKGVNRITIDTNSDTITMEAMGDIVLKAMKNIKMQAMQNIEMKAGVEFKAEANAQASVKANAQTSVESSGIVIVKGSLVKIN